jgi:hypothetical protein
MTPAERLARCVLRFHQGGEWTANDRALWKALSGEEEATTKVLCDLARETLTDEREKAAGQRRRMRR